MARRRASPPRLDPSLTLPRAFPQVVREVLAMPFSQQAQDAAAANAATGGVRRMDFEDEYNFEALVRHRGTSEVAVRLYDDFPDGIAFHCGCGITRPCEHLRAVALRMLAQAVARGEAWAAPLAQQLPFVWRKVKAEQLPRVEGNAFELVLGAGEESPETSGAMPAKRGRKKVPWWIQFVEESVDARLKILREVVDKHLGHAAYWAMPSYELRDFARAQDPYGALRRFKAAVSQVAARTQRGSTYDEEGLDAYLASDAVREAELALRAAESKALVSEWLSLGVSAPTNESRVELEWHIQETDGPFPVLAGRVLLSTQRLHRAPRHAANLQQLAGELRAGRRRMPAAEASFVAWLAEQEIRTVDRGVDLVVDKPLDWSVYAPPGRLSWGDDGTPVRMAVAPARLGVAPDGDGLVWTVLPPPECGMDEVPIHEAQLFRPSMLPVYRDEVGGVWARLGAWACRLLAPDIPTKVIAGLLVVPRLDPETLRNTTAGVGLLNRLVGSPESTRHLKRTVSTKATVSLRLVRNQLSLVATADGNHGEHFILTEGLGWLSSNAPNPDLSTEEALEGLQGPPVNADEVDATGPEAEAAPPPPHAIVATPDPVSLAPLETWLERLVPSEARWGAAPDGRPAQLWRLTPDCRVALFEAWAERPAGVSCLGDRAVRDLLSLRRPPQFRIDTESSGVDWLKVSVSMAEEMALLPLAEVRSALAESGDLVSLPRHGTYHRDELEAYARQVESLAEAGLEIGAADQRLHMMQLAGLSLPSGPEIDALFEEFNARARELAERFKGIPKAKIPAETAGHLRPYQRAGADFLVWAGKTFGGAVLADDMGLGKTLQVLAAISALQPTARKKRLPSLVVCPASVAHNWQREAQRFAPHLKTVVIERGPERRRVLDRLADYDLIIKNYSLTRRDAEHLEKQPWLVVCVDEAQAIKNPDAEISRVVKQLDARHRIALTGTPIENRLMDLWSIVDFAAPGYLGSRAHFEARTRGDADSAAGAQLRARLRPVLLRRMKQEVAPELPPRIEERLDCAMTTKQRGLYLAEIKRARDLLKRDGDRRVVGKQRIEMLAALTRLRQLCCDPGLRGDKSAGSGKVEVLMEMLPGLLEAGHKVLVFSQFVQMLRILETRLGNAQIPYYVLTGQTTKRQALVDRFEADSKASVFLISLKAGGSGLNLVSASHVVLFDPWWNPAVEAQAIDRTHRIGQDKTVIAFRLVSTETIEERIIELQERKKDLVKGVLEAETFNRSLSREDFEYLLGDAT